MGLCALEPWGGVHRSGPPYNSVTEAILAAGSIPAPAPLESRAGMGPGFDDSRSSPRSSIGVGVPIRSDGRAKPEVPALGDEPRNVEVCQFGSHRFYEFFWKSCARHSEQGGLWYPRRSGGAGRGERRPLHPDAPIWFADRLASLESSQAIEMSLDLTFGLLRLSLADACAKEVPPRGGSAALGPSLSGN